MLFEAPDKSRSVMPIDVVFLVSRGTGNTFGTPPDPTIVLKWTGWLNQFESRAPSVIMIVHSPVENPEIA
jgi:hypothetical protein